MYDSGNFIRQVATHYPDDESIRRVLGFGNTDILHIGLEGSPLDNWFEALAEAHKQSRLRDVLQIMESEYPGLKITPEQLIVFEKFLDKSLKKGTATKEDYIQYILIGFSVLLLVFVLLLLFGKI